MPYISEAERYDLSSLTELIDITPIKTEGNLNYLITMLCMKYLSEGKMCYSRLNAIRGVLGCAADEYYRRVCVPYEDGKMAEDGEVYRWVTEK